MNTNTDSNKTHWWPESVADQQLLSLQLHAGRPLWHREFSGRPESPAA